MAKPEKTFKCGPVSASIWINQQVLGNELVEFPSIKIEKCYLEKPPDGDDNTANWQHTNTFTAEDLPKVALVAQEVYKFLRLRRQDTAPANATGPADGYTPRT